MSRPRGSSRTQPSAPTTASAAHSSSSPASGAAIRRLSRTDPRKTWCSCVTSTTCRRSRSGSSDATGTPPTVTLPAAGASTPASSRLSVVLPAPDGPTTASRSPGVTVRSTPRSTSPPPSYAYRTPVTSIRSSAGSGASPRPAARGARARPSTRANDAPLDWSCSIRISTSSSGPLSWSRYSEAATTAPRLTAPRSCSQPPHSSTPATGTMYDSSTTGKNTERRNSVRIRVRRDVSSASRLARIRRSSIRSASTVRAPAAVDATTSATSELAAPSARYASRARRRYQRSTSQIGVRHSSPSAPSSGSTTRIAAPTNSDCTRLTSSDGPASRSVVPTDVTSAVPRVVRSPVPARSTTADGSASTRSTNRSRTRASVRSPNRCPT